MKRKISRIENTDYVDRTSGELMAQNTEITTFEVEKEPAYVKLYTEDVGRLFNLTNSCNNVLVSLARHMVYSTNVIVLYGPVKDIIMQELNMNKNTFNKAIDSLYKQGFLIRKSRACYILDPTIFGSGSWRDVKKLRLMIEYNIDGSKSIKTEMIRNNEIQTFGRGLPQTRKLIEPDLFDKD